MAKRLTDTNKWKKDFMKELSPVHKLFWMYLCDDCDHAGIWDVDFEVASMRIGAPIANDPLLRMIFESKVEIFDGGKKWWIPSFIEFQYGPLNPANKAHRSVLSNLDKNGLTVKNEIKGHPRGFHAPKDKDKDMDMDKDKGGMGENLPPPEKEAAPVGPDISDYETWADMAVKGTDEGLQAMIMTYRIDTTPQQLEAARLHVLGLLGTYPKMQPRNQQGFRHLFIKGLREIMDKPKPSTNGQQPAATVYTPPERRSEAPPEKNNHQSEEQKENTKKQYEEWIDRDQKLVADNPDAVLKLPIACYDFLQKYKKVNPTPETRNYYLQKAKEKRLTELNGNYDPLNRIILRSYETGKISDSENLILKGMAKELAYRDYLMAMVET